MVKNGLVVDLTINIGWMLFGKSLILFIHFLQKYFKIIRLHQHNGSSYKFENVYVFDELISHIICNFKWTTALNLLSKFLIWYDLLTVPPNTTHHLLDLGRSLAKLFNLIFNFIPQLTPVRFIVLPNCHTILTDYVEQYFLLMIAPTFLIFFTLSLVLKIYLSLILLNFNYSVDKLFESSSQVVSNWKVLIGLCLFQLSKAIFPCISNWNIVGISVFVYSQEKINIVLLAPPNSWPLTEQKP